MVRKLVTIEGPEEVALRLLTDLILAAAEVGVTLYVTDPPSHAEEGVKPAGRRGRKPYSERTVTITGKTLLKEVWYQIPNHVRPELRQYREWPLEQFARLTDEQFQKIYIRDPLVRALNKVLSEIGLRVRRG